MKIIEILQPYRHFIILILGVYRGSLYTRYNIAKATDFWQMFHSLM